ncbi:hypothetical protein B566_EDAN005572 [Ephemera danica]|nr:hypothetical protein B566_EDAN005572 [Ephemera danica]
MKFDIRFVTSCSRFTKNYVIKHGPAGVYNGTVIAQQQGKHQSPNSKFECVGNIPSGAELCSRDALRQYLCTTGTCKCGLECPLHLDRIFSFDPKVTNRAWPLITEPSELTRLCNHKRKQANLTAGPPRTPLHRNLQPDPAKGVTSPSGAELCSRDALRQYLCTTGTCKCGLECPLHLDRIFSFDPKVRAKLSRLFTF